ncbi:glycosyltransferase 87 family protein [Elioraea sp.]|uniref:glycosyltransferase 87 family protein n=1 Tax=Elioraea sp. TaxID=2185103 RepID=UPI003F7227D7
MAEPRHPDRGTGAGAPLRLALAGLGLIAATLIGTQIHPQLGDHPFMALFVAQGVLSLVAIRLAAAVEERRALAIILGVAVLARLVLVFTPPTLSTDVFRYIWDGRVQAAGINPYRHLPVAPELAHLRDAAVWPNINRADYAVTIYPPAAQMLFLLAAVLGDSVVAMKLVLVAAEAVTVAALIALLRHLRMPVTRVVAYAWHPLALWEIAGNAHIDGAMLAAMLFGLWLALVRGRRAAGAAVIAVAALCKPFAVLALPAVWRPWDWRAPAAAVATVGLLYLPYLSVGSGVFGFLGGYLAEEGITTGWAFWITRMIDVAIGPNAWSHPLYLGVAGALLAGLMLAVAFRREAGAEATLKRLYWLMFAFLFLLSPNLPWYWLLVLPFAVLFGHPSAWAATLAGVVLYDVAPDVPELGFVARETLFNLVLLAGLAVHLLPRAAAAPRPVEERSR